MALLGKLIPSCSQRTRKGIRGTNMEEAPAGDLVAAKQAAPVVIREGLTIHYDIPYVTNPHDLQKLDLHIPTGNNLAVVVMFHAGGFQYLDKSELLGLPYDSLLDAGYAIAAVNYRQSTGFGFPIPIIDCKSAIRWLRAHAAEYNLDPDRLCAFGGSSGGYLSGMIGATNSTKEFDVGEYLEYSSHVKCVGDFCGHSDFLTLDEDIYLPKADTHNQADSAESLYLGGPIQEVRGQAVRASVLPYITPQTPPFLVVHGDADLNISYRQSLRLVAALNKAGCTVVFHTCPGSGHGPLDSQPCVLDLILTFFATYL